jgi:hypothetical protein
MRKTNRTIGLAALVVIAAFAAMPAAGLAQSVNDDPTSGQYDPEITRGTDATGGSGDVGGSVAEEPSSGLNGSVGSLPFTGMDLIIIVGVALVLMGTGFALRRLSAPRPRA